MHEVTFKHRKSEESRKKDIFLKEIVERDGIVSTTERRCFYFIKDVKKIKTAEDIKKMTDIYIGSTPVKKRHFFIFKEHNDGLGADKLICKIAGIFYAIVDRRLYTIAFLHSFKVSFIKGSCAL